MYNFSQFTFELNEMEPDVAPTDTRLRLDIRAMEEGDLERADEIMHDMEVRHVAKKKAEPVWFTMKQNPYTGQTFYHFNSEYWQCKKRKDWEKSPNIF